MSDDGNKGVPEPDVTTDDPSETVDPIEDIRRAARQRYERMKQAPMFRAADSTPAKLIAQLASAQDPDADPDFYERKSQAAEGEKRLLETLSVVQSLVTQADPEAESSDYKGWEPPPIFTQQDLYDESIKPIDWIVDQLYTRGARGLIAAEGKAGKTFLVCHIGLCVASGVQIFSEIKVADPGPVLFVAGEDDISEMGRRLRRMCYPLGLDLRQIPIRWMEARRVRLERAMDVEYLARYIKDQGIRMAFFDPISRLMDGNENDKEVVARVLNPLGDLASDTGACIQIIHHLRKQNNEVNDPIVDRVRGSTDFVSWFTTGMFMEGTVRTGRVRCELAQRISGSLPGNFAVDVIESDDEGLGGLQSMRLKARLEGATVASEMSREQYLEACADDVVTILDAQRNGTCTMSELRTLSALPQHALNAAVKRLIRDRGVVVMERVNDLPERNAFRLIGDRRVSQARQDREVLEAFGVDPDELPDDTQGQLFDRSAARDQVPPSSTAVELEVDSVWAPDGPEPREPGDDDLAF